MSWFKRNKDNKLVPDVQDPAFIEQHKSAIEIVAHKNATKEAKEEVDKANAQIRKIFEHNGFHVKLYVAAGGRQPKHKGTH